ncbi:hypothetical protein UFOVP1362_47 [uncultured Caudovirales phage]|uniref:Scaffolding protein n=1 Tax=uncultured Caudovirales phage TaxID=2100421 RepID=A0A6J5QRI1_9CAUD|nr:hypothetical protein UFOVP1101_35 [uncultured Caudovirales phage]CAB4202046.1 hypothetical protein UFOVP1362_47 [uncultured Caudovirales phage]
MSEEVIAEQPAPEQDATAAPAPEVAAPEAAPEGEVKESKLFSQEDLDAAIGKRLAREQRKWEREARQAEAPKPVPVEHVKPEQFTTTEEYVEALTTSKAQQIVQQQQFAKQQQELLGNYHDKEEDARSKYEDFEQVAYNPKLPITQVMAQTIQASDNGPDIAYYLGTNPKEADRIARLADPFLQAKEIGKLEAKIASEPITKRTSSAPAPISPVTARGGHSGGYDTTDPRSIKTMTTSQWIEAERARQVKKQEARNR